MSDYTATNAIDGLTVEHLGPDATESDLLYFQAACRNYAACTGVSPQAAIDAIWGGGDYYERAEQWNSPAFISGYEDAYERITTAGSPDEPAEGWDNWAISIEGLRGFIRERLDAPYNLAKTNPAMFARLRARYVAGARLAAEQHHTPVLEPARTTVSGKQGRRQVTLT